MLSHLLKSSTAASATAAPAPTAPTTTLMPLQVAVGDIMAVQTMFARSFPLTLFDNKLSAADEAATVTLLMSLQVYVTMYCVVFSRAHLIAYCFLFSRAFCDKGNHGVLDCDA